MHSDTEQIKGLLSKFKDGRCTEEEVRLIKTWWLNYSERGRETLNQTEIDQELAKVWSSLNNAETSRRNRFKIYMRVAAVFALFAIGSYVVWSSLNRATQEDNHLTSTEDKTGFPQDRFLTDAKPGGKRAILMTPDGVTIDLDEQLAGIRLNSTIAYMNGQEIAIKSTTGKPANELFTIVTPTGGSYHMELPDGSLVWLNAESKLSVPLRFDGPTREVILEGEGYFEIAHLDKQAFIVKTPTNTISVLGTKFNVKDYANDPHAETTLTEGKVQITYLDEAEQKQSQILTPNQQAQIRDGLIAIHQVDPKKTLAWKNNNFRFQEDNIQDIMASLSRWYEIEVVYEGEPTNEKFSGKISRDRNISDVLRLLEKTKAVKFRIEEIDETNERRVIVMQ